MLDGGLESRIVADFTDCTDKLLLWAIGGMSPNQPICEICFIRDNP